MDKETPSELRSKLIENRLVAAAGDKDKLLETYERLKFFEQEAIRLRKLAEKFLVEYIQAHGDIDLGNGRRYYAGYTSKTVCTDKRAAFGAVLNGTGGDVDKIVECLASGALLPGKSSAYMSEEEHAKLFQKIKNDSLEEDKAAPKTLQVSDENFKRLPKGKGK